MRYDVIVIGGGLAGCTAAAALNAGGCKVALFSEGLTLHDASQGPASHKDQSQSPYSALSKLSAAGVTVFRGDSITGAEFSEDGTKVLSVSSRNLGDEVLTAKAYLLATGKFFSRGIISSMDRIYEPVFNADVEYEDDRDKWYDPDFFAVQPYEHFGVKTDAEGLVVKDGRSIVNLFAAGQVLAGEPLDDEGIESSGRKAAAAILKTL